MHDGIKCLMSDHCCEVNKRPSELFSCLHQNMVEKDKQWTEIASSFWPFCLEQTTLTQEKLLLVLLHCSLGFLLVDSSRRREGNNPKMNLIVFITGCFYVDVCLTE